jgi:hypothetical protein
VSVCVVCCVCGSPSSIITSKGLFKRSCGPNHCLNHCQLFLPERVEGGPGKKWGGGEERDQPVGHMLLQAP